MQILLTGVLSFMLASLVLPIAYAQVPAELVFAVRPLPPYMEPTADGYRGSHIDIMHALAKRLGVRLRMQDCATVRCLRMLEEGTVDVSMGFAREPSREAYMYFLQPPYASPTRTLFYMRKNDPRNVNSLSALNSFKVGLVRGVFYTDALSAIPEQQRDYAPDMESNFRKLIAARIDVVPAGINVGTRVIEKLGIESEIKTAQFNLVVNTERFISLSRYSPWYAQRQLLEREFAVMVNNGLVAAILYRYEEGQHSRPVPINK